MSQLAITKEQFFNFDFEVKNAQMDRGIRQTRCS